MSLVYYSKPLLISEYLYMNPLQGLGVLTLPLFTNSLVLFVFGYDVFHFLTHKVLTFCFVEIMKITNQTIWRSVTSQCLTSMNIPSNIKKLKLRYDAVFLIFHLPIIWTLFPVISFIWKNISGKYLQGSIIRLKWLIPWSLVFLCRGKTLVMYEDFDYVNSLPLFPGNTLSSNGADTRDCNLQSSWDINPSFLSYQWEGFCSNPPIFTKPTFNT